MFSVQVSNWFKNRRQRERVPPQKEPMMGEITSQHPSDQFTDDQLSQGELCMNKTFQLIIWLNIFERFLEKYLKNDRFFCILPFFFSKNTRKSDFGFETIEIRPIIDFNP